MTSANKEINLEFEEFENFNIECFSQITRPCPIKYKCIQQQQPQVQPYKAKSLIEFIKNEQINLKRGERYGLVDMAVTSVNK